MKKLAALVTSLLFALSVNAELKFQEIRTASNNVLVVYYKSDIVKPDEVKTDDPNQWKLDGQPVSGINKYITEADNCDHHIYLQVPMLVNGTSYKLQTPHGEYDLFLTIRKYSANQSKPIRRPTAHYPKSGTPISLSGSVTAALRKSKVPCRLTLFFK